LAKWKVLFPPVEGENKQIGFGIYLFCIPIFIFQLIMDPKESIFIIFSNKGLFLIFRGRERHTREAGEVKAEVETRGRRGESERSCFYADSLLQVTGQSFALL
jgi:hypothetical protein